MLCGCNGVLRQALDDYMVALESMPDSEDIKKKIALIHDRFGVDAFNKGPARIVVRSSSSRDADSNCCCYCTMVRCHSRAMQAGTRMRWKCSTVRYSGTLVLQTSTCIVGRRLATCNGCGTHRATSPPRWH